MLRLVVLCAASAIALASAANAADMYRAPESAGSFKDAYVPADSWTGFYLGLNGGYGWSATDGKFAYPGLAPSCNGRCTAGYAPFSGLNPDGGFGGGQIGYNWQGAVGHPSLVLGVEADILGADIGAKAVDSEGTIEQTKLEWFGTVRGRLGYAMDRSLIYFTGGFAYGGLRNSTDSGTFKFDSVAAGYVLGGGLEYKLDPAWSLKAEYQYINLGKNEPTYSTGATLSFWKANDDAFNTARLGLNYHFGVAGEPLK